jgi:hypothetical protein
MRIKLEGTKGRMENKKMGCEVVGTWTPYSENQFSSQLEDRHNNNGGIKSIIITAVAVWK